MPTSANCAKVRDLNQEKRSRVQSKYQLSTVNNQEYNFKQIDNNNKTKENVTNFDNKIKEPIKTVVNGQTKRNASIKQLTRLRKSHPSDNNNNIKTTPRVTTKLSTRLPKTNTIATATREKCSRYASRVDLTSINEEEKNKKPARTSRRLIKKRTQQNIGEQVKNQLQNKIKNAQIKQRTNQKETKNSNSVTTLKIDIQFGVEDGENEIANVKIEQSQCKINNDGDSETELDALVVMISGQNETHEMDSLIKTGSEIINKSLSKSDRFFDEKENENIPERDISSVKDGIKNINHENKDKFTLEGGDGVHISLPKVNIAHKSVELIQESIKESLKNIQKKIVTTLSTTKEDFKLMEKGETITNNSEKEDGKVINAHKSVEQIFLKESLKNVQKKIVSPLEDFDLMETTEDFKLMEKDETSTDNTEIEDGRSKKVNNATRVNAIEIKDEIKYEDDQRTNEVVQDTLEENGNTLEKGELPTPVLKAFKSMETKEDLATNRTTNEVFKDKIQNGNRLEECKTPTPVVKAFKTIETKNDLVATEPENFNEINAFRENVVQNNINAENDDKAHVNVIKIQAIETEHNLATDLENFNKIENIHDTAVQNNVNADNTEKAKEIVHVIKILSSLINDVKSENNVKTENENVDQMTADNFVQEEDHEVNNIKTEIQKIIEQLFLPSLITDVNKSEDDLMENSNNINEIKNTNDTVNKHAKKKDIRRENEIPKDVEINYSEIINNSNSTMKDENNNSNKDMGKPSRNEMVMEEKRIGIENETQNNAVLIDLEQINKTEINYDDMTVQTETNRDDTTVKTEYTDDEIKYIDYINSNELIEIKESIILGNDNEKNIEIIENSRKNDNEIDHQGSIYVKPQKKDVRNEQIHDNNHSTNIKQDKDIVKNENIRIETDSKAVELKSSLIKNIGVSKHDNESIKEVGAIENQRKPNEIGEDKYYSMRNSKLNKSDNEKKFREDFLSESETSTAEEDGSSINSNIANEVNENNIMIADQELSKQVENKQMIILDNDLNATDTATNNVEEIPADKIKTTHFYNESNVDNDLPGSPIENIKTENALKASDEEIARNKNLSIDMNYINTNEVTDTKDSIIVGNPNEKNIEILENSSKNGRNKNLLSIPDIHQNESEYVENIVQAHKVSGNVENDNDEKESEENYATENITAGISKDDVGDHLPTQNAEENAKAQGESEQEDELVGNVQELVENVLNQNAEEHELFVNVLAQSRKEHEIVVGNLLAQYIQDHEDLEKYVLAENEEEHEIFEVVLAQNIEEHELVGNVLTENLEAHEILENILSQIAEEHETVGKELTQNVQEYEQLDKYVLPENVDEREILENVLTHDAEEHEIVGKELTQNVQEYEPFETYLPAGKVEGNELVENVLRRTLEIHKLVIPENVLTHTEVDYELIDNVLDQNIENHQLIENHDELFEKVQTHTEKENELWENIEKAIENAQEKYETLLQEKNSATKNTNDYLPDIPEENELHLSSSLFYLGISFAMGLVSSVFMYFYSTIKR